MPLTAFQARVARLLSAQRAPDSYLAGGAALHLEPNTRRYSNHLDYFQDSVERVAAAFDADRRALSLAGLEVRVVFERPGFVRAMVSGAAGEATKVEWVHDSAWRFLPVVAHELAGYVLHPLDLAVNKLLALVGRDEPRDFLDIMDVDATVLSLGAMVWAAPGKDPGFTPTMLLDLLRRRGRYRAEDFARLHLREPPDVVHLKTRWLAALEAASAFIESRDPAELGCRYYSRVAGDFPREPGGEVVPHYGRPGGVLPQVG